MRVSRLHCTDTTLEVIWENRQRSEFLFLWLRDNCTCPECGDTRTGGRFLRLHNTEHRVVTLGGPRLDA